MSLDKLQEDLDEIKHLSLYIARIRAMLEMIITKDCVSVMSLGLIDQNRPQKTEVEVNGEVIDWESLGAPDVYKKMPFLILPNAKLRKQPKYDLEFDLELTPMLLIPILKHIMVKSEQRVTVLKKRLDK